jgi:hypothetical protein
VHYKIFSAMKKDESYFRISCKIMKRIFIIPGIFLFAFSSCEKDSGFGLEIYLLSDFKTSQGSGEIISGSEKLAENPLIRYHDIKYYDSSEYYFKIEHSKAEELNHKDWSTKGTPFALTINKSVIYSGYIMPGYSSSGVQWFTMDPFSIDDTIFMSLGYPGDYAQLSSIDPRNDERIIYLLKNDNKLRQ